MVFFVLRYSGHCFCSTLSKHNPHSTYANMQYNPQQSRNPLTGHHMP
jgi:hypothetical protein